MATDRYSDDHKIVVGGGSGTLTVDANLNVSSANDINIESTGGDINLTANNGVVSIDGMNIYRDSLLSHHIDYPLEIIWHCDYPVNNWNFDKNTTFLFFNDSTYYDLAVYTNDLNLSSRDDVYIRAGISAADSTLLLSANNNSSPYIRLKKDTDTIDIVASEINLIADAISASALERDITIAISPASFVPCLDDSDADVTTLTLNGAMKHRHANEVGGDIRHSYFAAPLPSSIPNGASIDRVTVRIEKAGQNAWVSLFLREKDLVDGSIYNYIPANPTFTFTAEEDTERTDSTHLVASYINKSRFSYTLIFDLHSIAQDEDTVLYIHGMTLTYITKRLDNND